MLSRSSVIAAASCSRCCRHRSSIDMTAGATVFSRPSDRYMRSSACSSSGVRSVDMTP